MEPNNTIEQKTFPIDKITNPLQRFMNQEKAGGIVLAICVVIAMFLANSGWSEQYFHFFEHKSKSKKKNRNGCIKRIMCCNPQNKKYYLYKYININFLIIY